MEHLWALAVLACIWAFVATHPIRPHDFWWHLEIGREIAQTGSVPSADSFSYTAPGAAYPAYRLYWLSELLLYLVFRAGGPALSVLVHTLIITLTYALTLALCWRLSGSGRVAALCTLAAAALGFENWNLRPQAITFLLAAIYLWQIYEWRRRPGRSHWHLAWFPGLMAVWVNCHGSFPLGLVLVGLWLVETLLAGPRMEVPAMEGPGMEGPATSRPAVGAACASQHGPGGPDDIRPLHSRPAVGAACASRRAPSGPDDIRPLQGPPLRGRRLRTTALLATGLTALAMLFANPAGPLFLWRYLRQMAANPVVQNLPEWAPASLATKDGVAYFVILALSVVLLLLRRRRLRVFHLLSFVMFAALAWKTGRAIVWFGLVLAPMAAELLSSGVRRSSSFAASSSRVGRSSSFAASPEEGGADGEAGASPHADSDEGGDGEAGASPHADSDEGGDGEAGASPHAEDRAECVINAVLALGLLALMIVTLPWLKSHLPLPEQKAGLISAETPLAATQYLLRHAPPAPLFSDMGYGSYLIWAAPRYLVFADPRVELYPPQVWADYHALSRGDRGWQSLLDRYGVRTLMLDLKQQAGLFAAVRRSPQWQELYRDRHSVILVRRPQ